MCEADKQMLKFNIFVPHIQNLLKNTFGQEINTCLGGGKKLQGRKACMMYTDTHIVLSLLHTNIFAGQCDTLFVMYVIDLTINHHSSQHTYMNQDHHCSHT